MLRPIDTQTIYQQTQELANKQQVQQKEPEVQQNQFATIMQHETAVKQEKVNQVHEDEQIKNQLDQNKKHKQAAESKKYKKRKNDKKERQEEKSSGHIDIRI